jgi:hypothetical protein
MENKEITYGIFSGILEGFNSKEFSLDVLRYDKLRIIEMFGNIS